MEFDATAIREKIHQMKKANPMNKGARKGVATEGNNDLAHFFYSEPGGKSK